MNSFHNLIQLVPVPVLLCFAAFYGACLGSFMNVVFYRVPQKLSVLHPVRSFCPACKYQLSILDNVPILSYLVLRGKCRKCSMRISPKYLIVEIAFSVLFVAIMYAIIHFVA